MAILDRLFGRGGKPPANLLAVVRNITIGRTVVLDPLAWRRLGTEASFRMDRDTLSVTAQGLVKLDAGGYVHRFYTDDHLMLQAVSDDREGQLANDFTLFVPWRSRYPDSERARRLWNDRLRDPVWMEDDLPPFQRLWFGPDEGPQPPVTFWEEVWDERGAATPSARIFQTCMLYSRDLGEEGRELLLAITQETEGGETTLEIMVGVPLAMGEFTA
jgi:hypothetical protein